MSLVDKKLVVGPWNCMTEEELRNLMIELKQKGTQSFLFDNQDVVGKRE